MSSIASTIARLQRCRTESRPSGFTIIELLVVISVIAMLMALLMPALKQARESANTVMCSTKMRTLGMWSWQFAEQYKYYPRAQISTGGVVTNYKPYVTHANGSIYYSWNNMLSDMLQINGDLGPGPTTPGLSASQLFLDPAYFADTVGTPSSGCTAYGMNLFVGGGFDYGSLWGAATGSATTGQWIKNAEFSGNGLPYTGVPWGGGYRSGFKMAEVVNSRNRILFADIENGTKGLVQSTPGSIMAGPFLGSANWSNVPPGHGGAPTKGISDLVLNNQTPVIGYRHMTSPVTTSSGTCTYDSTPNGSYSGTANVLWTDLHVQPYKGTTYFHSTDRKPSTCSGNVPLDSASWCPQVAP